MKTILSRYYRLLTFLFYALGISVLLDTFVLKQFLKNMLVKANTSDYSIYSTDGVANWIILITLLIFGPAIIYIIDRYIKIKEFDYKAFIVTMICLILFIILGLIVSLL